MTVDGPVQLSITKDPTKAPNLAGRSALMANGALAKHLALWFNLSGSGITTTLFAPNLVRQLVKIWELHPPQCPLVPSILLCLSLGLLMAPSAIAQNKALPRSGFSNYSGANMNNLPSAGGVHLGDGEDRNLNAPPEVYPPGEKQLGMKLVRWEPRHMPIRVWVSPGGRLPEEPFSEIQANRPREVLNMMLAGQDLNNMPQCPGWTSDMTQAAINGIEQWRELQNEGLFAFEFVDDPSRAQVLVFWVDRFVDSDSPGGSSVHGNTSATLFDANLVHNVERRDGRPAQGAPVIIELKVNGEPGKLQADTAHEFGHALGIKEHSPYRQDIMCVNRQTLVLSPSDKATMRWLYRQAPQFVMLPPVNMPSVARQPAAPQQAAVQEPEQPSGTGRYKVNTLRQVSSTPSSDGYDPATDPDGGSAGVSPVEARPEKKQPLESGSKKSRGKRSETSEAPVTAPAPPDDFQNALDEIRGVKRKERPKPKPVKERKGDSSGEGEPVDNRPSEPSSKPSDGF